jgi:hypothetical protein
MSFVQSQLLVRGALYTAANLITERGHATMNYETEDGALCLAGAINKAVTGRAVSLGGMQLLDLTDTKYLTVHAAKRALVLTLPKFHSGCRCLRCRATDTNLPSARDLTSGKTLSLFHSYTGPIVDGRVTTGLCDNAIGAWNDNNCPNDIHAVRMLREITPQTIRRAVRDEFGPDAEAQPATQAVYDLAGGTVR